MMTKAENTTDTLDTLDTSVLAMKIDAVITRADGRTVDTRVLWAPDRPTLDAALDLAMACAMADGSVSIRL